MNGHVREPCKPSRWRGGARPLMAVVALVLAVGCDREHSDSATERAERAATRVKTETRELVEKAKHKKAEWSAKSEERLKQLDDRLVALDRRLEELGGRGAETAHRVSDETLDRLRNARRDAREALDKARRSGADAWEGAKQAGDEALDRLEDAYRGATATLRGDR